MCGIAGVVRREARITGGDRAALARMLRAERHRGPDGEGCLERGSVLLGHVRLAVIDLSSAARQPMPNETGEVWMTYNGEIYNFRELRRELRSMGHVFRSATDAEVVLHGYESWGVPGLLNRLRGMFAFALLDTRSPAEPKLYLVRDRFGIKPLYYARVEEGLLFASELAALVASGRLGGELAPNALTSFLRLGSIPSPATALRDVHTIPPGHYLEVSGARERLERFWSLPVEEPASARAEEIAIRDIGQTLSESVARHLVSEVPLGVFSSGGIDSATLVALASRYSEAPVTTLSVVFDEDEIDEAVYARRVAATYGTDHREVRVGTREFAESLPGVFRAMDQPTVDGVNSYLVSRAAREAGLTVVLTGVGGDEVFLGYDHFRILAKVSPYAAWLRRAPQAARSAGVALARRLVPILSGRSADKLDYLRDPSNQNVYLLFRGLYGAREISELVPETGVDCLDLPGLQPSAHEEAARDLLGTAVALEFHHYLHNQLLRDTDAMSMCHSVEARVPFLDHALVEEVARLPNLAKLDRSVNKPLLLRALEDPLPRAIWDRPKQGFTLPFRSWMLAHRGELETRTLDVGLFPAESVRRSWRELSRGRVHWSRPWALVAWTAWHERFRDLRASSARPRVPEPIAEVRWATSGA